MQDHIGYLMERIEVNGDCWIWQLTLDRNGYGKMKLPRTRKTVFAHRFVYEVLVSNIPENMTLDHLCRICNCVNPDHLEPVTNAENIRRGQHRLHCKKGHYLLIPKNRYDRKNGRWACRPCNIQQCKDYYQNHKRKIGRP